MAKHWIVALVVATALAGGLLIGMATSRPDRLQAQQIYPPPPPSQISNCPSSDFGCKPDESRRETSWFYPQDCPTSVTVPPSVFQNLRDQLQSTKSCSGPYRIRILLYNCPQGVSQGVQGQVYRNTGSNAWCQLGQLEGTGTAVSYISDCEFDYAELDQLSLRLDAPRGIQRYYVELTCCSCCNCGALTEATQCPPGTWYDWYPYDRLPGEGERSRDKWTNGQGTFQGISTWDIPDPLAPLPDALGSTEPNFAWFWLCDDPNNPACPFNPMTGPREIDTIGENGQSNNRWGLMLPRYDMMEMYVDTAKMGCIPCAEQAVKDWFERPENAWALTDAAVHDPRNPFTPLSFRLPGSTGLGNSVTGDGSCRIFFKHPLARDASGAPNGRLDLKAANLLAQDDGYHHTSREFVKTTLIENWSDPGQSCNVKDLVNDYFTDDPIVCDALKAYCAKPENQDDRRCDGNQPRLFTFSDAELAEIFGTDCPVPSQACAWCIQDYETYRLRRKTNSVNGGIVGFQFNNGKDRGNPVYCAWDTCTQYTFDKTFDPKPGLPYPGGDPSNRAAFQCPTPTPAPPPVPGVPTPRTADQNMCAGTPVAVSPSSSGCPPPP